MVELLTAVLRTRVRDRVIRISESFPPRTFANFTLAADTTFHVFLMLEGTEFQVETQNFYSLQPVLVVESESMVALAQSKFNQQGLCDEVLKDFLRGKLILIPI